MQLEFDKAKDVANQTKHGVSLALADELNWEARWFGLMTALSTVNCV